MEDGIECFIVYVFCLLIKVEKVYFQIDKEVLSIYWGVQKFYIYLYGCYFMLIIDYKLFVSIFYFEKQLFVMIIVRLQCYVIFLLSYNYSIEYRNIVNYGNVDGLLRLFLFVFSISIDEEIDVCNVFYFLQFENLFVICDIVRKEI